MSNLFSERTLFLVDGSQLLLQVDVRLDLLHYFNSSSATINTTNTIFDTVIL